MDFESINEDIDNHDKFETILKTKWAEKEKNFEFECLVESTKLAIQQVLNSSDNPEEKHYLSFLLTNFGTTQVNNNLLEVRSFLLSKLATRAKRGILFVHKDDLCRNSKIMLASDIRIVNVYGVRTLSCYLQTIKIDELKLECNKDLLSTMFALLKQEKKIEVVTEAALELKKIIVRRHSKTLVKLSVGYLKKIMVKDLSPVLQSIVANLIKELVLSKVLLPEQIIDMINILATCLNNIPTVNIQQQIIECIKDIFVGDVMIIDDNYVKTLSFLVDFMAKLTNRSDPPVQLMDIWCNCVLSAIDTLIYSRVQIAQSEIDSREIGLVCLNNLFDGLTKWMACTELEVSEISFRFLLKICKGYHFVKRYFNREDYLECNESSAMVYLKWLNDLNMLFQTCSSYLKSRIVELITALLSRSKGQIERFNCRILNMLPQISDYLEQFDKKSLDSDDSEVYDNNARSKELQSNLGMFVGSCIQLMGINRVLDIIPLSLNERYWLVPLMREYVENTDLDYFRHYCLTFAETLTTQIDNCPSEEVVTKLQLLRYQIWECLPSFCKKCQEGSLQRVIDIRFGNGNNLYSYLLEQLTGDSHLEVIVMSALENLIKTPTNQNEMISLFSGPVFNPNLVKILNKLYMQPDCTYEMSIKSLLEHYFKLFEINTFSGLADFMIGTFTSLTDRVTVKPEIVKMMDLLIILTAFLNKDYINKIYTDIITCFLSEKDLCTLLQKKTYRLLSIICAASNEECEEFVKANLQKILDDINTWKSVKVSSYKFRVVTLSNLFKLVNGRHQIREFMKCFASEIIFYINDKNYKTRNLAGQIIVESITRSTDDIDTSIDDFFNDKLSEILNLFESVLNEDDSTELSYNKTALSKVIVLMFSEPSLKKFVSQDHIQRILSIIRTILLNYRDPKDDKIQPDRTLVKNGLSILQKLLKHRTVEEMMIEPQEIGSCIKAANDKLLLKVRMPMKKVIRNMLKLWDYELVKNILPESVSKFVSNIHKAINRSARRKKEDPEEDAKSESTRWVAGSSVGSNMTMKNRALRRINDIIADSDDENDEELKTVLTKSSVKSLANSIRKQNKRKIKEANAQLNLYEDEDNIIDLQDPSSLMQSLNIVGKKRRMDNTNDSNTNTKKIKILKELSDVGITFRGQYEVDQLDPNTKSEQEEEVKSRFSALKKRPIKYGHFAFRAKEVGKKFRAKKGVLGDMKRKNQQEPYAVLSRDDVASGALLKHRKILRANRKQTVLTSKFNRKKKMKFAVKNK